jgi:hypothetical protein
MYTGTRVLIPDITIAIKRNALSFRAAFTILRMLTQKIPRFSGTIATLLYVDRLFSERNLIRGKSSFGCLQTHTPFSGHIV